MDKLGIVEKLTREATASRSREAAFRSNSRFTLVLRENDFRDSSIWTDLTDSLLVKAPDGEYNPEEVELKVVGGKAY